MRNSLWTQKLLEKLKEDGVKSLSVWGVANLFPSCIEELARNGITINYYIDSANHTCKFGEVVSVEHAIAQHENVFLIFSYSGYINMRMRLIEQNENIKTYKFFEKVDLEYFITGAPKDYNFHYDLAIEAYLTGKHYLASAQLSNAKYLGLKEDEFELGKKLNKSLKNKPLQQLDHNLYYRLYSLAKTIEEETREMAKPSILDIGGGDGILRQFLEKKCEYILAEPSRNGMIAYDLPFRENEFDVVVSCHVLEHVPDDKRSNFLDNLLRVTKYKIILLNPFQVDLINSIEINKFIYNITKSDWAKEHLECGLPDLKEIKEYAMKRRLSIKIMNNGNKSIAFPFVFLNHFIDKNDMESMSRVNEFFNKNYIKYCDSDELPIGNIIVLEK
jgi:hypothetical protein